MSQRLRCQLGHLWEPPAETASSLCPVCGSVALAGDDTVNELPPAEPVTAPVSPTPPSGAAGFPDVPGYEVLAELGRGGMGIVYKARQTTLKRLVALKMILSGPQAGAAELARFRAEAESAARLQHPNIVQVHEVGEHDGRPFFSLEYVEGGSLAARLGGTPLPPTDAAALVETLARAVQAAHDAGVVHRDLKPANILLQNPKSEIRNPNDERVVSDFGFRISDLTPKVTDFGLAKKLDDDAGQTQSGAVIGTPSYMAPEQALGRTDLVGPLCDVYALGAVLYECLTGRPPFRAATLLDTLEQVRSQEPVAPSRLTPTVPRDLETICLKCLEKEPHKRYPSASALAEDLRRFREGEPIVARPVGAVERGVKWVKRRPASAALIGLALLSTTGAFAGVLWDLQRVEEQRQKAESRRGEAERSAAAATAAEKEAKEQGEQAKRNETKARAAQHDAEKAQKAERERSEELRLALYSSNLSAAEREWLAGANDRGRLALERCDFDLRGWEWQRLRRLLHGERREYPIYAGAVTGVAFSPDGEVLAGVVDGKGVSLKRLSTGQLLLPYFLGHHPAKVLGMAYNPDGRLIATAGSDKIATLWDARAGKPLVDLKGHTQPVNAVAFSADGGTLASASDDGTVKLWSVRTGKETRTLPPHPGKVHAVAFGPPGELASACDDGVIRVFDRDGKEVRALRRHTRAVRSVAYSPDGRRLASAGEDGLVVLWDAATGQVRDTIRGEAGTPSNAAFSPDGRWLAAGLPSAAGGAVKVWDVETAREVFSYGGFGNDRGDSQPTLRTRAIAFSPDGRFLAASLNPWSVITWPVRAAREAQIARAHIGGATALAFSANGELLASAGWRTAPGQYQLSEVKLWDAVTQQPLGVIEDAARPLAFHPKQPRLAAAFADGSIRLLDRSGKALLTLWGLPSAPSGLGFSPDGSRVAATAFNPSTGKAELWVWNAEDGKKVLAVTLQSGLPGGTIGHPRDNLQFSPDGRRLLVALDTVRLLDAADGKELLTLQGSLVAAFSPDGKRIVTAGYLAGERRRQLILWDAEGKELATLPRHDDDIFALAWAADGRRLATAAADRAVHVWDVERGRELFLLRSHDDSVNVLAFSPDGRRLATAGAATLKLWDGTPGREIFAFRDLPWPAIDVVYSSDGRRVIACNDNTFARVWDAADGKVMLTVHDVLPGESVAVSADGRRLVAAMRDRTVKVWDVPEAKVVLSLPLPEGEPSGARLTPDGSVLAVGLAKKHVAVWESGTGRQLGLLRDVGPVFALTPDGKRIVAGGQGKPTKAWEVGSGREAFALTGAGEFVRISPDGRRLTSADKEKTLRVWDETGKEILALPGGGSPRGFSRDGRRLLTTMTDRDLAVRETDTGKVLVRLASPSGFSSPVFSPDEKRLAWGSASPSEGTTTVCDVATGRTLLTLSGSNNWIPGVAFSPDGKRLVTSCVDSTVTVWDVTDRAEPVRSPQQLGASWHLAEAEESELARNDFAAAFHLGRLLAVEPERVEWRWRRGRALARAGRLEEALAELSRAIERAPDNAAGLLARVLVRVRLGRIEEAEADYARAADSPVLAPARPWWETARRTPARDWQNLAAEYTAAIEAGGQEAILIRGRGLALLELGRLNEAKADFKKAADADGKDFQAWRGLAWTARAVYQPAEAEAACAKALALKADEPSLLRLQGILHASQNRPGPSAEAFAKAIEKGGDRWWLRAELAAALASQRRWEPAAAEYTRALDGGADDWNIYLRRGEVRAERGRWDEARTDLEAACRGADIPRPWELLALLDLRAGDQAGYRRRCEAVRDRFATHQQMIALYLVRVYVLGPGAFPDPAVLVALAELPGKNPWATPSQGAALYRAARYKDAAERLAPLVGVDDRPGDTQSALFLAMAKHQVGEAGEAKALLERAGRWIDVQEKAGVHRPWDQRLSQQLLRREAEKLIVGT